MTLKKIFSAIYNRLNALYWKCKVDIDITSIIDNPLRVKGKGIKIGKRCYIQAGTWLECNPLTDNPNPRLIIGNGCIIGHYNEIYSTSNIIIEDNVLTADRVYISDNLHGYADIDLPVVRQKIVQNGSVRIGEGSWLGVNVCVLGAKIGKHCVIGANSVVTGNIPDFCVAVGAPARIVKRYNPQTQKWEKTDNQGNFI